MPIYIKVYLIILIRLFHQNIMIIIHAYEITNIDKNYIKISPKSRLNLNSGQHQEKR